MTDMITHGERTVLEVLADFAPDYKEAGALLNYRDQASNLLPLRNFTKAALARTLGALQRKGMTSKNIQRGKTAYKITPHGQRTLDGTPRPGAADRLAFTQAYESCVLGADGQCSRWSHDHGSPAEPEPERVTVQYDLPGTHPVLTVGISDRARVLIGERIGDSRDPHAGVNWITAIAEPVDVIMTTLEQARVDQIRVARQIHPSDLRMALRAELSSRPGRLATLDEIEASFTRDRHDLIAELARMRDDGEVRFMGARYWLTEKTVQP